MATPIGDLVETKVLTLPDCDFHPGVKAAYDGRTRMGPWANMCPNCMVDYGLGVGLGRGQLLVLDHG